MDRHLAGAGSRTLRRVFLTAAVAAAIALTSGAAAQAVTLGSISHTGLNNCSNGVFWNTASAAPSYTVPAPGGWFTSWSIATDGATAGAPVDLVVLRQVTTTVYTVIGFDAETLPTPLPASNVATFTVASPIQAQGGDVIGLYSGASPVGCYTNTGTASDAIVATTGASAPSNGGGYTVNAGPAANLRTNISADLAQSADVGVTETVTPASIVTGGVAIFRIAISNAGPAPATLTLTDGVPASLSIIGAASDLSSCTVAGQNVTCSMSGLMPGSSAEADIAVTAGAAGSFTNTATASAANDPNPANNVASAGLAVTAPAATPAPPAPPGAPPVLAAPAPCRVLSMAGIPLTFAKTVLSALNCRVGKVTTSHSTRVPKGDVLSNSPRAGTFAAGTRVNIVASSGPKKKKKKK